VEVVKCDNTTFECKTDDEIRNFLNEIYFTTYYSNEIVDFDHLNHFKRDNPVGTSINDAYLTQFSPNLDKYQD